MGDLSGVKVGDKLCIRRSHYQPSTIEIVERVTPTGRVITKSGAFERSGYMRGGDSWSRPYAWLATEDDIAGVHRYGLVSTFKQFDWNRLTAEDLKAVDVIVKRYPKERQ